MKECPKCHTRYDDTMNFCTKDGSQLIDLAPEEANPMSPEEKNGEKDMGGTSSETKRKGRWKRTLLIVIIVLIVCCTGVYNYVMNATTYFDVEPKEITIPKSGKVYNSISHFPRFEILSDGYVWKVKNYPSWLDISVDQILPFSFEPLYDYSTEKYFEIIMARPNGTGEDREGTIRLQSGKHTVDIVVHQKGN